MPTKTVLGLSFNTRMMAIAIMHGTIIIHYHTSFFKGRWNSEKQDRVLLQIAKLLLKYPITDVALALPYESHTTNNLEGLLESLTTFFKSQKIPICSYNQEAYSIFYEEGQRKRKKMMMEAIVQIYPELQKLYQREIRNKNKYYHKLFEAIALAHIYSQNRPVSE